MALYRTSSIQLINSRMADKIITDRKNRSRKRKDEDFRTLCQMPFMSL